MVSFKRTCTGKLLLILLSIFVTRSPSSSSSSARTLNYTPPPPQRPDQPITFLMNDIPDSSHRAPAGQTTGAASPQLPPPSPLPTGNFLPAAKSGGRTLMHPSATFAVIRDGRSTSSNSWIQILASLQALEAGTVTEIDEELTGNLGFDQPPLMGKVQGIYVTSTEKNSSHIVAMKVAFADGGAEEDSLRFFGVHRPAQPESHIPVVGGAGKYHDANGFAIFKAVLPRGAMNGGRWSMHKVLSVAVYLK